MVEIDIVTEQENDDLLRLFSHHREHTGEAQRFWAELVGTTEANMAVQDMEGYDEVMQKLLDTLKPEQRLAGLGPEQLMLAISSVSDEMLRGLPDDIVEKFKAARDAIRQRVGRREDDDLLRLSSRHPERALEARRFWGELARMAWRMEARVAVPVQDLEGYDEVMQKLLDGVAPRQRLAGLTPEQILLALSDDVLRGLPTETLEKLLEAVGSALRQRAGR